MNSLEDIQKINRKMTLNNLRLQAIVNISTQVREAGLEDPLNEHYEYLIGLRVDDQKDQPSNNVKEFSASMKKEEEYKQDKPLTTTAIKKEDWDDIKQNNIQVRKEAFQLVQKDLESGKSSPVPTNKPVSKEQLGFELGLGYMKVAIKNLTRMIDTNHWDNEFQWKYYGCERGSYKKYNLRVIELVKEKIDSEEIKNKFFRK